MDPDKAYNIQRSAQRFAEKEEDAPEVDPDKAYNVQMAEQKMPFTPQMMMEPVDLGEFYKNQAAIGTVNTLKLLGYGGTWAIANWQMLEGEERDQYVDNNMRIIEQTLNDVAGVDPDLLKSGNYIHDTLGGGVQALFDPFSYTAMGIGSRAYNFLRTLFAATKTGQVVPATGAAANLVGRAGVAGGTALVAGTAAGPGVDIAESFLDAMGVESEGARLGGMLAGGFLGGAAGIKASGAIAVPVIKTGVGKLRGPVASGWQKARNLYYGIDDMDNTMTGDVYQKLKLATRENPDFEDIIISATEMAKEVPDFILPVEAIAADNAVLMPFMSRAIRNNPEYRYKTQMRIKNARDALEKWRLRHHGVSGDAADKLVRDSIDSEFRVKRKRIATELENNSKKMNQAMQRLEVGEYKEQIGNEATRLVKDRIKFLREQYGMQYDIALRKAEKAGLRLEPQAAITFNKNIQQFFQNHVFEEMPKTAKKVRQEWSLKKLQSDDVKKNGIPLKQLDSLRRQVNDDIRTVKKPAKKRMLKFLREEIDNMYATIPGYGEDVARIGNKYKNKIGVPLSQEGIKQLSRDQFNAKVAGYLTNYQTAQEFLDLMGPSNMADAEGVVKRSLLIKAADAARNSDGHIDLKKLNRFKYQHRQTIDLVPGLRDTFDDINTTIREMNDNIGNLNRDYRLYSMGTADTLYKSFYDTSLSSVVKSALTHPKKISQYYKEIQDLETPEARELFMTAFRAEFLENARRSSGSMVDYVNAHPQFVTQFFGEKYKKNLDTIVGLSDILNDVDIESIPFNVQSRKLDPLEESTGVPTYQGLAIMRRAVASVFYKISALVSKSVTSKAEAKEDEGLMDWMYNPKSVDELARFAAKVRTDGSGNFQDELTDTAFAWLRFFGNVPQASTVPTLVEELSVEDREKPEY